MLHGTAVRFHPGSVALLRGAVEEEYANQSCSVLRFDTARRRWAVRLVHPSFGGREISAVEEHLSFSYCVLPDNAAPEPAEGAQGSVQAVEAQGACGRGLCAARECAEGEALFEEEPFLLAQVQGSHMWLARWLAYLKLYQGARASSRSATAAQHALDAFQKLQGGSLDAERRRETEEAAAGVLQHCFQGDKAAAVEKDSMWRAQLANVGSVLARWKANQFRFGSGTELGASAVFRRISRINHSCSPTVGVELHWSPLLPGSLKPGDGRAVVRAKQALQPGDALCFNYGPRELVEWPLAERRRYLLEHHGFICGCARCAAECLGAHPQPPLPCCRAEGACGGPGAGGAARPARPARAEFRCSRQARRGAFPRRRPRKG